MMFKLRNNSFKIYSLLVVKNEGDIIVASLKDAIRWSDKIIVIDNGSDDDTWEKINQMSIIYTQIVPFMRYEGAFHIGLRAKAFHAFKRELTCRDWWCVRMDADEFFRGDVRDFLSKVPACYGVVKKESTDYLLTVEDVETECFGGNFEKDRHLITHYLPNKRKERRFMRHSCMLQWLERWRYPHPMGLAYGKCIDVDHYQYRSPQQMERRYLTRQKAKSDGCGSFRHENGASWKDYLLTNRELENQHWLLNNLSVEFAKSDNILYHKRNVIKIVADDLVVKSFQVPSLVRRIIYTILPSKARRSYLYALRLGAYTPKPIAYKENFKGGLLFDSYYVSQLSHCRYVMKDVIKNRDFECREYVFEEFGRFTAEIHDKGIYHKDYSMGNILFDFTNDGVDFQLVDLNRISFKKYISLEEGCRGFERIDVESEVLEIIARSYAIARGFDEKKCIELVKKYRWRKHK